MRRTDLASYDAFTTDLFARLDGEFGARDWTTPLGEEIVWAGETSEADEGTSAVLPLYEAAGVYAETSWPQVSEIVAEVGAEHGFSEVRVLAAAPGDLVLTGFDQAGGTYRFEMGVNTVFRVYVDRTPLLVTPVSD